METKGSIRTLIVDDSSAMRRLIGASLRTDPEVEIVGSLSSGGIAVDWLRRNQADVITLDIEMPGMDGIATLEAIRLRHPAQTVIMCSSLTRRGALVTLDALAAGARDYVTKPESSGGVEAAMKHFQTELLPRVKALAGSRREKRVHTVSPPLQTKTSSPIKPPDIVAIAVSTGGPNALEEVFKNFVGDYPLPIVIVQHMPPVFTRLLAERLDKLSGLSFFEGEEGMKIEAGCGYIAPGGRHMTLVREGVHTVIRLNDNPKEHSCRPAADVLFRSLAPVYGGNVLCAVLTGMGCDGRDGCAQLRKLGAEVIAQDEASSVVWGMPGAVVKEGLAHHVVPLDQIQMTLLNRARKTVGIPSVAAG